MDKDAVTPAAPLQFKSGHVVLPAVTAASHKALYSEPQPTYQVRRVWEHAHDAATSMPAVRPQVAAVVVAAVAPAASQAAWDDTTRVRATKALSMADMLLRWKVRRILRSGERSYEQHIVMVQQAHQLAPMHSSAIGRTNQHNPEPLFPMQSRNIVGSK